MTLLHGFHHDTILLNTLTYSSATKTSEIMQCTIVNSFSLVDLLDNFDWKAYLMEGVVLPNYEMDNDEVNNNMYNSKLLSYWVSGCLLDVYKFSSDTFFVNFAVAT